MMTLRIAGHEFRYMLRSLQTLVVFAVFFGLTFLLTANGSEFQTTARGGNVLANSPFMITKILILISIFAIFMVPSFMASTVLKDLDHKFDGILFATPISKRNYLHGRFLGAFAALMVAMAGAPIGMLLGSLWPLADPTTLGPIQVEHYLYAYFVFMMSSMLLVSAMVFAIAVLSRNMLYTYLTALGLWVLYLVVAESDITPTLWDPFMFDIFEQHTLYWTAAERNTKLIGYQGIILTNRLIWFTIAAVFYGVAFRIFTFRTASKKVNTKNEDHLIRDNAAMAQVPKGMRGKALWTHGIPFQQLLQRTKFETLAVVKSLPFLLLVGFSTFLLIMALINREVMYEVNAYPITRLMAAAITESLVLALLGVVMFYSAEIIWRERKEKFNEIMDALPVPNWVFVVSKVIALMAVINAIMVLGIVLAISLQILEGYHQIEISIYLKKSLFIFALQFIFLGILACFLQVLAKNRLIGMVLMALFMGVSIGAMDLLGFEHPLLRYGLGTLGAQLSDMNGGGRFVIAANWHRSYWASIAGLLLLATYVLWNRGTLQPLRFRLRAFRIFKSPAFALSAAFFLVSFLGTGAYIYYNTNVLNDYVTSDQVRDLRIAYEHQYRQYQDLPMPRIVAVNMEVDLFPYQRRVEARGSHTLRNKTNLPIETIHMVFPSSTEVVKVALEGGQSTFFDEDYNYHIFDLETPMQPGEVRALTFETLIQQKGFTHSRPDKRLVRNGTFIHNNQLAPYIGFNPDYMISDRNTRRKYGLEPLARVPALEDTSQYGNNIARQDSDFLTFETVVSTVKSQTAISVGSLEKEWTVGDRRYFKYKMDAPIRNFYAYLSAEYEVARDTWNGIDIQVLHHRPHTYNIDRLINGVKDSLAYFNEAFSPYQYQQVRIVEFPAYRKFAQAFPNTIPYSEDMGFVAKVEDDDIDMPYYVTAHEMAHQWWGHQLTPANTQGASFLNETLAQYGALLVTERKYGKSKIRKFLKFELDRYLSGRADDPEGELPLYKVEKQEYIHYRKGSLVMYALRDYLGEAVVNRTLKRLLTLRAYSATPYATSLDFLDILKQEAGPENLGLIQDFFEKITLYDLKVSESRVIAQADGRFLVIIDVAVAKYYADAIGNETEAQFDIPVDIGLFSKSPASRQFDADDVILLEKRSIQGAQATLEILVDKKPKFVGIDPYNKLIDRDADDNLASIKSEGIQLASNK